MSEAISDPLDKLIRDAGEGWLIDWYAPRHDALPHIREVLQYADDAARRRFGKGAPSLTPEALRLAYEQNPHKVRAFLQVIGSVASPDMLVMVWRVLQGIPLAAMRMDYDAAGLFRLHVRLTPTSGPAEEYESDDIDDAVVLRHFGIMKLEDQGVFDGFYALNLSNL